MSKNHSHDNIYSILGKLEALQPTTQEKHDATVQQIRESVEAQGSILKGLREVGSVEQRLAKQFAESKIEEKAVSQAQQKFMGMVHAAQKGEKAASPEVAKVAKSMGKKDAKDFAATKHKGLPQHVEEAPAVCAECGMVEGECEHTMAEGEFMGRSAKYGVCVVGHNGGKPVKIFDTEAEAEAYANKGVRVGDKLLQGSVRTIVGEGETTHKDGVTKHRKTDFPGYPSDDLDDSEEDENKGKRGRPRKHAKKKDTGEKRGRGRPSKHSTGEKSSKDNLPFSSKNKIGHDPFGRVKKDAEKTVAESMDSVARKLTEGVNFANLLKEKHQTVDEMLAELSNDMKVFKETGHCSELLRDCMEIKGYHGKMMADEGSEQGIGQDLVTPQQRVAQATPPKPGVMNKVTDTLGGMKDWLTGKPENPSRPTYEENDSLAFELDELAKLAGLQTSEGNAFTGKLASTPKGGSFELDGKTFKDTSGLGEDDMEEGNAFSGAVAKAKADGVQPGEKINVGGKEYPVKEEKIDVADAPESVNKPRPKFASIKTITTQGDDMNREKSQDPATANKAANPLTNKGRVSEATLSLEAQLAAEYESIKKVN